MATFELSAFRISRWYTEVEDAMIWRRDPEISVVSAPMRYVKVYRCRPSIVNIERLGSKSVKKTMRTGRNKANPKLATFRPLRPCHVMPMETIVSGTPAAESG